MESRMTDSQQESRETWERSYRGMKARGSFNTAPVEAIVRNTAYYLRERYPDGPPSTLHFLEMGCGSGVNLRWLAEKGVRVSGIDIADQAVELCRDSLNRAGLGDRVELLARGSVTQVPLPDGSVDGIVEACVFQHLRRADREAAFAEVRRLLRPGGLFVGYLLEVGHTIFREQKGRPVEGDPGTLYLETEGARLTLEDLGVCHFFTADEVRAQFAGFSEVSACLATYELPESEARRRGVPRYLQSMIAAYAVK
jgi:tellurite methyltransferase